ncbi:hypothetical protein [Bacillus atrophaeus]|jgi:hypothetical protein|uniref:hypothetical protein n=1 Tax=Bacillus atrophaeus TaxID=1452 RepID=UPI00228143F9|nr:hypothetical protein [Bacillus atrophaeus]MCY8485389.1 hypothetical protein [Bacillus atrophaeus]MCY8488785.1 hypothetical protein [Bacillus atrophaeus]MCY8915627.1 hypothetical protein [Bacillus atrophaeus]MCY8924333.1 hypothetical protein [Bacillus atrophaeus]MDL5143125.1 hypothetical protein [Bacillus atrophaeus]
MSQEIPYIKTSGLKLGENDVKVPTGLSDLLNLAGVWQPQKPKKLSNLNYESSISMIDGHLTTTLSPIKDNTKINSTRIKNMKGVPA